MKRFRYTAINRAGETVIDEINGENEQEVMLRLSREKLRLINIKSVRGRVYADAAVDGFTERLSLLKARISHRLTSWFEGMQKVDDRSLLLFTQQMSTILGAGLNISSGLQTVLISETNPRFRKVIEGLIKSLEGGSSAYQAFSRHPDVFSGAYTGLINVGESSGRLPFVLWKQAIDLEKFYSFKRKTIASLTYPAIILVFAILSILIMMIYFVPNFTNIYNETKMELPFVTRTLIFAVACLTNPLFWLIAIAFSILLIFLMKSYLKTVVGRQTFDRFKLALPIIGEIVTNNNLYGIYLNLACMLECGVHITDALRILRTMTQNEVFRDFLDEAMKGLNQGLSLYEVLREFSFIPRYAVDLVQTGESTGELPDMVRRASTMMEERINQRLESFLNILEPVIITALSFVVGYVMIAIFLPLYNMISSFSP